MKSLNAKFDASKVLRTRRDAILSSVALLVLVFLPAVATAETYVAQESLDAAGVLGAVDSELTGVDDMRATGELVITDASGSTRERTLDVMQKGDDLRLIRLTDPARLEGVGLLSRGEDQNYLYLPAFGRVRRIAGQQRGEPFLDSDFTNDDLTRTTFSSRFDPELVEQTETHWTLRLVPTDPEDEPYSELRMEVRKEDYQIAEILFFEDDDDEADRRLTTGDFQQVESQIIAHSYVAEDLESGSRSELELSDVEVNVGLDERAFTRRRLQR